METDLDNNPNLARLQQTCMALGDLIEDFTFVGGAVVSLYETKKLKEEHRVTEDVDAVIQAISAGDYIDCRERLVQQGFEESHEDDVMVRFRNHDGLMLDVMSTPYAYTGGVNSWYEGGIENRIKVNISRGTSIYIFPLPYYFCTKMEAFQSRGNMDGLEKEVHDLEDLIRILRALDDKTTIYGTEKTTVAIREFFRDLLKDRRFFNFLTNEFDQSQPDWDQERDQIMNFIKAPAPF